MSSLSAFLVVAALSSSASEPPWLGTWCAADGSGEVLWFEPGRAGWLRDGEPRFYRLHPTEEGMVLERWSHLTELSAHFHEGGALHLEGAVDLLLEACATPEALRVEPYAWPHGVGVDAQTRAQLQAELAVRREEDQRVRGSGSAEVGEMMRVDADNTAFVKRVCAELGWIDAERFGPEASRAAFLLVQHTSDVRLMRTALPFLEADVRAGRLGGSSYALLYDRLQLNLGYPQRYGSQIGISDAFGRVLMPCEDRTRVDELRSRVGLGALDEYLEHFRDAGDGPRPRYLPDVLQARLAGAGGGWIPLFNGRDLEGWRVKIAGHELDDNFADTFRVQGGVLRVDYDGYGEFGGRFGHLVYERPFEHYRLRVEYRFVGEACPGAPRWAFRNSGVMLHGQAPESMGRDQEFPVSLEAQMLGGDGAQPRSTGNLCTPGTHVEIDGALERRHCISSVSDTYHGDDWVTLEVEVHGDESVEHFVEGALVLSYARPQLDESDPHAARLLEAGASKRLESGYLSLQAEGHPIEFRAVELLLLE